MATPLLLRLFLDVVVNSKNLSRFEEVVRRGQPSGIDPRASLSRKLAQVEKRIETAYDNLTETPKEMAPKLLEHIRALEAERQLLQEQLAVSVKSVGPAAVDVRKFLTERFDELLKFLASDSAFDANVALRKFVARADVQFESRKSPSGKKLLHTATKMLVTLVGGSHPPAEVQVS